jgi:hypothetical protein
MPRTTISDVHVENAYSRVQSEEGAYDAHVGYNIYISWIEDNNTRHHAVYVGQTLREGSEEYAPSVAFADRERADEIAGRIESKGSVNLDGYWYWYGSEDINALPAYVTDWSNPLYN